MQNTQQEKHSWLKLTIILIIILLLSALNILASFVDVKTDYSNDTEVLTAKLFQVLFVILIFIFPCILFAIYSTKSKIHYLGITKKPLISTLVIGGIAMLLAIPLINYLNELNHNIHLPDTLTGLENWMRDAEAKAAELTNAFTQGTSVGTLLLNLFVIALMAALSEEIFFRGVLQKVLIECLKNKHIAIWIGAAIFSAFHMQFLGFIPRTVMGAFLGYLFLWSGSLWPSILAHFINNATAVVLFWMANRGIISVNVDTIGTNENQLMLVIPSVLIVAICLFLIRKFESSKLKT